VREVYECQQMGHLKRDCPASKGQGRKTWEDMVAWAATYKIVEAGQQQCGGSKVPPGAVAAATAISSRFSAGGKEKRNAAAAMSVAKRAIGGGSSGRGARN
jgi:hypothetical protein